MGKEKAKNKNKPNPSDSSSASFNKWLPYFIFLLSFIVYSNTLQHQYAQDDDIYTRKNVFIQKGISAFPDLLKQGSLVGFDGSNVSDYRPLVLVNFALEKSIFGNNPKTNHFFNVLFYALACCILFSFLKKILHQFPIYLPFLITVLFVLHPIHTEVIANIKNRDELLCFIFGMLALSAIFTYATKNNLSNLVWSCIFFFCSLLSKENGFTYLAVIPLLLYFFSDLSIKRIAVLTLPFIALAGINLLLRIAVLDALLLNKSLVLMDNSLMAANSFSESLATNFTMLLKAIILLVFPLNLSYDYSYNQFPIVNWTNAEALSSALVYLLLLGIAIWGIRKKSIFSFAILFYLIMYSITSNLIFKIGSSFAERFLFGPSLAICLALPFIVALFLKLDLKKSTVAQASTLILFISGVSLLFAFKTVNRNTVWKDNPTLFASGLESAPNSARVHFAYANDFREKVEASADMYQKSEAAKTALAEFNKGLEIYDKDERIYYNMGVIYYNINEIEKAKEVYQKALRLKPDYPEALNNLGVIFFNNKEYTTAQIYFKKATEINKNYADAFANLGACFHNSGDAKSAIPFYKKAIELNPANVSVMRNLSMAYSNIGDTLNANYFAKQAAQ